MMTGYLFPVGVQAQSIGTAVGRILGPRDPHVPPYIYIGRDIDTSDTEKQFINEYIGPGFYGLKHAPFMIPDPTQGLASLSTPAGMTVQRLDRRLKYWKWIGGLASEELHASAKVNEYVQAMESARAMMDSPVKQAFNYLQQETPETIAAYEPKIAAKELLDRPLLFWPPVRAWLAIGSATGGKRLAVRAGRIPIWAIQGLRHARKRQAAAGRDEKTDRRSDCPTDPRSQRPRFTRSDAGGRRQ